jgi:hypothetical protein
MNFIKDLHVADHSTLIFTIIKLKTCDVKIDFSIKSVQGRVFQLVINKNKSWMWLCTGLKLWSPWNFAFNKNVLQLFSP